MPGRGVVRLHAEDAVSVKTVCPRVRLSRGDTVTRRSRLRRLALALVLAAVAWAGAAAGQGVSVDDDGGHRSPATAAQRVVALAPHLTELVFAAGGGERLVGVIRYSDHPLRRARCRVVGDAFALNLERIAQLKPDLVLVWHSGLGERQREQLRALKLPVYESEIRRVEDIAATLRRLGTLLGTRPQPTPPRPN